MSGKKHKVDLHNAPKNILAGALVLTPLLATWWVVEFLFNTLSRLGRPGASAFFTAIHRFSPELAEWLFAPWVEYVIALVLTLVVLYLLGWATTRVLGRRLVAWVEALLDRLPLVKMIYGAVKNLIAAFQTKPEGVERVVLADREGERAGVGCRVCADHTHPNLWVHRNRARDQGHLDRLDARRSDAIPYDRGHRSARHHYFCEEC